MFVSVCVLVQSFRVAFLNKNVVSINSAHNLHPSKGLNKANPVEKQTLLKTNVCNMCTGFIIPKQAWLWGSWRVLG